MNSIAEIKAKARYNILGNFRPLVYSLIMTFLIILIIYSFFYQEVNSLMSMLINIVAVVLMYLFSSLMYAGRASINLKIARGEEIVSRDIWNGFRGKPFSYIGASLILMFISLGCMLPFIICYGFYETGYKTNAVLAAMIVLYIAGMIAYIIISLSFLFVILVLADIKISTVSQAFKISRNLTRGRKGKLFLTLLSFIGLYIVSILSFGIGFLWVIPYVDQTLTVFYLEASEA